MVYVYEEKGEHYSDSTVTEYTVENNKNQNIDDVGVADESLPKQNNYDESTCSVDSVYGIFEEEKGTIALHDIVWVKTDKSICQDKEMRKIYTDMPYNTRKLKTKWLYTKT